MQFLQQSEELGVVVNLMKVVEDDEQRTAQIACAEAAEGIHHLGQFTPRLKHSVQAIAVNVADREPWPSVHGLRAQLGTSMREAQTCQPPRPAFPSHLGVSSWIGTSQCALARVAHGTGEIGLCP